jgi:site-specific DNA-methyltransferase (adenine-specific)
MKPYYEKNGIVIYHGDCLDVMPGLGAFDMVLADPPYGTTVCKWDSIISLAPMWEQLKRVIKDNGAIVMTASQPFITTLISSNMKMFRYCWVWEKEQGTNFLDSKRRPLKVHEDIVVFSKKQSKYFPQMTKGAPYVSGLGTSGAVTAHWEKTQTVNSGTRYPRSIQKFKRDRGRHPTQKPVPLMEYLIKTYSQGGETVLDFTMGSGTTGVAAINTGRKFIGIELDEAYCEIAARRIDETFADIAA